MDKVLIKPKEGLRVRDPATAKPLPPEGKKVILDAYWLRRLNAGDVFKVGEVTAIGETSAKVESDSSE